MKRAAAQAAAAAGDGNLATEGDGNLAAARPSKSRYFTHVPWRGRDAVLAFLLPWVILPIGIVVGLSLVAPSLPAVHNYLHALSQNSPGASFSLVVVDAVGSFAVLGYYLRKYHAHVSDLGVRPFSIWRAALYLLLILLAFGILVTAAYWVAQAVDPSFNASQPQTDQFTGHASVIGLLALVIIPPFIEEPVFRGFMFPAFARKYGTIIGAIITSLLFGLAHLQGNVSVYTFVLSLLLCWLYTRVRSIIPGIGLHMLNNAIAYFSMNHK